MKPLQIKYILTLFLLLSTSLLLQGCLMPVLPDLSPPAIQFPTVGEETPEFENGELPDEQPERPGRFTLRYGSENTMNPILALNRDNINLTSLMFESLFSLNDELVAEPVLVSQWSTEDYITFTFEILPNIAVHDGSTLTADDVVYSLVQASQRGRHIEKLTSISSIESDGELTVTIELDAPNARFIRLLDIPIIKEGTIEMRTPPGTGLYTAVGGTDTTDTMGGTNTAEPTEVRLVRFPRHRYASNTVLSTIYLRECHDNEVTGLFDSGDLSLLWDDPTGAHEIRLNRLHEPRPFHTTAFQYIGFNSNSNVLQNPDVRRAVSNSINRQQIVYEIMSVTGSGQTIAAPAVISPVFDMYDPAWEHVGQDPLIEMAFLLDRAGLEDIEHDGFLQMSDGFGGWGPFVLDFIVNIENSHKVAAANLIAGTLIRSGVNVDVRALPWSVFIYELEEGNFDMFYGETKLGADFDLSPLLLPGPLNFGGTANTVFAPLISDFLAASTQAEVSLAGQRLIDEIRINAPFAPILYKRHFIYTPIGAVTGTTPGQSGIFRNFQDWNVNLYVLN